MFKIIFVCALVIYIVEAVNLVPFPVPGLIDNRLNHASMSLVSSYQPASPLSTFSKSERSDVGEQLHFYIRQEKLTLLAK